MRFAEIHGNDGVKRALAGMVDSGKIPHAILFHEDDGCGAVPMCVSFLQYLFCRNRSEGDSCGACAECNKIAKLIHPDIHFVYPVTGGSIIPSSAKPTALSYVKQWRELVLGNPYFTERDLHEALGIEGKSSLISVAEAREILGRLSFHSLEGGWRAVVMYLPEKMNAEAANRLLKSIVNTHGEVVGIRVRSIGTLHEGGLGLAVPIGSAKSIVEQLIENGFIPGQPTLSFKSLPMPSAARAYYGLPAGAFVESVDPGGAAERAGIMVGVITGIDAVEVSSFEELDSYVKNTHRAGDVVTLRVYRANLSREVKEFYLELTLDEIRR